MKLYLWPSTGSFKIRLLELRGRLIAGRVIDAETSMKFGNQIHTKMNYLQILNMSCLVALYSYSIYKYLPRMWMASRLMYTSDVALVLLTFGVVRFVLFYNCFKKCLFRFTSISVYCFQSCQSEYNNCDGRSVLFEQYSGLDI